MTRIVGAGTGQAMCIVWGLVGHGRSSRLALQSVPFRIRDFDLIYTNLKIRCNLEATVRFACKNGNQVGDWAALPFEDTDEMFSYLILLSRQGKVVSFYTLSWPTNLLGACSC